MTHPRQLIRDHVVTLLTGAVAGIGDKVFKTRVYSMQREEAPGICVYTLRETSEDGALDGMLDREIALAIDIYARNRQAPDDELDGYCEAVEALMNGDPTLGRGAASHTLVETVFGYDGEGEKANAAARLRYRVRYQTP